MNNNSMKYRSGISIIEVMASILVAMIGVFGVMVMIPFAVSQAQNGIDQEDATSMALNAVNEFEIRNHIDTSRIAAVNAGTINPIGGFPARVYIIDPLNLFDSVGGIGGPNGGGYFPFTQKASIEDQITMNGGSFVDLNMPGNSFSGQTQQNILVDRTTILDSAGDIMDKGVANHLFSWSNDLVFALPDDDDVAGTAYDKEAALAPPLQMFDIDALGNSIRRQSQQDLSYIVVMAPNDIVPAAGGGDRVISWRNYFVVFKKRPSGVFLGAGDESYDRLFQVKSPLQQVTDNGAVIDPAIEPTFRLAVSGGDLEMQEVGGVDASGNIVAGVQPSSQATEIKRGDWMMLTNITFNPSRFRYFQQINFYKVIDADSDGTSWNVSLQGPSFDFLTPLPSPVGRTEYLAPNDFPTGNIGCNVEYDSTAAPTDTNLWIQPSATFAVHLPDVWAVFERTYR